MTDKQILIIDDNPMSGEVLAQILQLMGITSITMQDSATFEDIRTYAQDLAVIFVDLEMPNVDGYELLRILGDDMGLTIPIVAYTVHTSELIVARELGFNSFLGKPLNLDHTVDLIQQILDGGQVWSVH